MYEKTSSQRDTLKRALSEYEKYLLGTLAKSIN